MDEIENTDDEIENELEYMEDEIENDVDNEDSTKKFDSEKSNLINKITSSIKMDESSFDIIEGDEEGDYIDDDDIIVLDTYKKTQKVLKQEHEIIYSDDVDRYDATEYFKSTGDYANAVEFANALIRFKNVTYVDSDTNDIIINYLKDSIYTDNLIPIITETKTKITEADFIFNLEEIKNLYKQKLDDFSRYDRIMNLEFITNYKIDVSSNAIDNVKELSGKNKFQHTINVIHMNNTIRKANVNLYVMTNDKESNDEYVNKTELKLIANGEKLNVIGLYRKDINKKILFKSNKQEDMLSDLSELYPITSKFIHNNMDKINKYINFIQLDELVNNNFIHFNSINNINDIIKNINININKYEKEFIESRIELNKLTKPEDKNKSFQILDEYLNNDLVIKYYGRYPYFNNNIDSDQQRLNWINSHSDNGNLFYTILSGSTDLIGGTKKDISISIKKPKSNLSKSTHPKPNLDKLNLSKLNLSKSNLIYIDPTTSNVYIKTESDEYILLSDYKNNKLNELTNLISLNKIELPKLQIKNLEVNEKYRLNCYRLKYEKYEKYENNEISSVNINSVNTRINSVNIKPNIIIANANSILELYENPNISSNEKIRRILFACVKDDNISYYVDKYTLEPILCYHKYDILLDNKLFKYNDSYGNCKICGEELNEDIIDVNPNFDENGKAIVMHEKIEDEEETKSKLKDNQKENQMKNTSVIKKHYIENVLYILTKSKSNIEKYINLYDSIKNKDFNIEYFTYNDKELLKYYLISKVNEYGDKFKEVKNKKELQNKWTIEYSSLSEEDKKTIGISTAIKSLMKADSFKSLENIFTSKSNTEIIEFINSALKPIYNLAIAVYCLDKNVKIEAINVSKAIIKLGNYPQAFIPFYEGLSPIVYEYTPFKINDVFQNIFNKLTANVEFNNELININSVSIKKTPKIHSDSDIHSDRYIHSDIDMNVSTIIKELYKRYDYIYQLDNDSVFKPCGLENDIECKYQILYKYITTNTQNRNEISNVLYEFTQDNIIKSSNDNGNNISSLALLNPIEKINFDYDKFIKICVNTSTSDNILTEYSDVKEIENNIKDISESFNKTVKIKLLNYDYNNKVKSTNNDFSLNIKPININKTTKLFEKNTNIEDIDIKIKDAEITSLLSKLRSNDKYKQYINIIENIGNYDKKYNYSSFLVSKMKNLIGFKYNDEIIDYYRLNNTIDSINEEILSYKVCINLNRYLLSIISATDYSRANVTNIKFIEQIQKFRQIHMSNIYSFNKIKFTPLDITFLDDINSILNFYKYVFYTDLLNITSSNLNNDTTNAYIKLLFDQIKFSENTNNVDSNYIDQRITFINDKKYRDMKNGILNKIDDEVNEFDVIDPNDGDEGIKVVPDEFDENDEILVNEGYGDAQDIIGDTQ